MIFFSSIWNTFRKATKVEFGKWRSAVCQPGDGEECGSADRMSLFALEDIHPDHLPHPPSPPITSPSKSEQHCNGITDGSEVLLLFLESSSLLLCAVLEHVVTSYTARNLFLNSSCSSWI